MTPAYIQGIGGTSSNAAATSQTTGSFPSSTTNGNLIVAICSDFANDTNTAPAVTSVTDNKGNTYTKAVGVGPFSASIIECCTVWYAANIVGGSGHTVTAHTTNNTASPLSVWVMEYSGVAAVSPLDQAVGSAPGISSTTPTSTATATTTQSSELVVAGICTGNQATPVTAGSGYSNNHGYYGTVGVDAFQESKVVATTGTQTGTFTLATAHNYACCVATFKAAGQDVSGSGTGSTEFSGSSTSTEIAAGNGSGSTEFSGTSNGVGTWTAQASATMNFTGQGLAGFQQTGSANGYITFSGDARAGNWVYGGISWTGTSRFKATGDWTIKPTVQTTPTKLLSGIIQNQNTPPPTSTSYIVPGNTWYFQEFFMPDNYTRGLSEQARIPDLTGFQICVGIDEGTAHVASLSWSLESYEIGVGWQNLGVGTAIGAQADGDFVWFDIYFDHPVQLTPRLLKNKFRFGVQARSSSGVVDQVVPYDGEIAIVNGQEVRVALGANTPFNFMLDGTPGILYFDTATQQTYYSVQQGVNKIWYTDPNPLHSVAEVYSTDLNAIQQNGNNIAFLYRILGATADSGIDFLGNHYRQAVIENDVGSIATNNPIAKNEYWTSKPNPSRFAVENIYFDLSGEGGSPQVVDRFYLDPLTPNMTCNVYWSVDGDPGQDADDWDHRTWHWVPVTYVLRNKNTYALPSPVAARYMKLEFSQLQAKFYEPFNQYKPIEYKKFPTWCEKQAEPEQPKPTTHDPLIASFVELTINIFNLVYISIRFGRDDDDYYPDRPWLRREELEGSRHRDPRRSRTRVDTTTLIQISANLNPWQLPPSAKPFEWNSVLTASVNRSRTINVTFLEYSIEKTVPVNFATPQAVSTVQRDQAMVEQKPTTPAFKPDCQHDYKVVQAPLKDKKAFFAGVKEVAFLRDRYTAAYDSPLYIETAGDDLNLQRNDFVTDTDTMTWVSYSEEQ